ncbi:PRTase-like protein [Ascobolus immersus RN42]|uniref:uracil phosphoribosyltransferase n=1 Tax=Ascobolus immersus RN42 TaxID=1160509 RepID=A0A3N4IDS4_ASCIM|nr:PRTase-like protein [Ascobolus immersus RN42]
MSALPSNIHPSTHPAVRIKLSQLRSAKAGQREVKALTHEIGLILAVEALGKVLKVGDGDKEHTPLKAEYTTSVPDPGEIALVPILRSGLGMVQAFETILPLPVAVYHLGLFRDKVTLQPVEYYNNLPSGHSGVPGLAIIVDPVIATGGTAEAAIHALLEWGVKKVVVAALIGSDEGLKKIGEAFKDDDVEVFVGAVDQELTDKGMIFPGIGDIGDRLFLTHGK